MPERRDTADGVAGRGPYRLGIGPLAVRRAGRDGEAGLDEALVATDERDDEAVAGSEHERLDDLAEGDPDRGCRVGGGAGPFRELPGRDGQPDVPPGHDDSFHVAVHAATYRSPAEARWPAARGADGHNRGMREWLVASGIVEGDGGILLVRNRRRDGSYDWSPPGGVVEVADGEAVVDGLTREVREETGLRVTGWAGPVWSVEAEAPDAGYHLRVEVYRALGYEGELYVDDPDGIVVDARFVPVELCPAQLEGTWTPTHEPLGEWLVERWAETRAYRYRIAGTRPDLQITRL